LVFREDDNDHFLGRKPGEPIIFPCKVTHPKVSLSLFRQTRETTVQFQNEYFKVFRTDSTPENAFGRCQMRVKNIRLIYFLKVWDSSSSFENSRWSFDPKKGLTLKDPTIFDSTYYFCVGHLPLVNGKRVSIKHFSRKSGEFRRWLFSTNQTDATDILRAALVVEGNRLIIRFSSQLEIIDDCKTRNGTGTNRSP
jgi:hypothetical protein